MALATGVPVNEPEATDAVRTLSTPVLKSTRTQARVLPSGESATA